MTALLDEVKNAARFGEIRFVDHAEERSFERNASPRDVRAAILSATLATLQDNGRIRIEGGLDRDGDALNVVAKLIHRGLLVITLY